MKTFIQLLARYSRKPSRFGWAGLLALALAATGCASIKGARTTGALPTPRHEFRAGVAKVDITPLPGYPMGGHSIAATIGRGVWTRLHATGIYLEDADGHPLVLVSCDLWSMPAGLADRVADLVARDPAGKGIGRQAMIFAATHTHQSPGNFSSSLAYNFLASPKPWFDQQLFDYLARRITTAVLGAVSNAQPAHVVLTQSSLPSAARNRSMPAFLLDPECKAVLAENASILLADASPEYPDRRASRAVDARLRVLRIEGQQGLIALVGFLAIHPTALSHETEVYSADIFGIAETLAEQSLPARAGASPCVVLFNGAEGDVSPMWEVQDRATAWSVGSQIAVALAGCASGGDAVEGNIRSVFGVTSMAGHSFVDDGSRPRKTAEFAEGGAALVAGAEDGRTIFNDGGHREGTRSTEIRTVGQGAKMDMLATGLPANLPAHVKTMPAKLLQVPKTVPLGVAQMGGILFATLPGEFTTVMGRRIETALKADNPRLKEVILVGLANEYLSYFTTPEEYDAQQYEGASTLYGPASGPLVESELSRLARECASGTAEPFPLQYRYSPGLTTSFLPPKKLSSLYNADDGLSYILQDTKDRTPYRRFPSISWNDTLAPLLAKMGAGQLPVPRVWVEVRAADGSWGVLKVSGYDETNEGLDFVTVTSVTRPNQLTWTAFWMPPHGADKGPAYRLCVNRADGTRFQQEFRIPADCPLGP